MATAHDVAAYVQASTGGVDRLKLQKLVYYAQAWTLAWDGRALFPEPIQAWRYGPVVPSLWRASRYLLGLLPPEESSAYLGDRTRLTLQEAENVEAVVDFYNGYSGWQLRDLTHVESPWLEARGDLPESAPSQTPISPVSMRRYYARKLTEGAPTPQRIIVAEDMPDDDLDWLLPPGLAAAPPADARTTPGQ